MIKDKITQELRIAFAESIKKTEDSNKEHGFFICLNKDGKLTPSHIRCKGEECKIRVKRSQKWCQGEIHGFFHTHPQKSILEKKIGRKVSEEDKKNITIRDSRGTEITAQTPSYGDVLTIFITKCEKYTNGTICTAGDLEPDKVGCWTAKKDSTNFTNCTHARIDHFLNRKTDESPKRWIIPLFDIEDLDLKQ